MIQYAYETYGEWLTTPLDISNFTTSALPDALNAIPHFHSMPKGGLIEGFIPQIGYNGITPTEERTQRAIAHIVAARESGQDVKTRFHSWANIIAYAANELDFEDISTKLAQRTEHSLKELRRSAVKNINTAIEQAPVGENHPVYAWVSTLPYQIEKKEPVTPEQQEIITRLATRLRTGEISPPVTEQEKQAVAELLYPAFHDHCMMAAPDAAMLYASANRDKPYADLYAEKESQPTMLEQLRQRGVNAGAITQAKPVTFRPANWTERSTRAEASGPQR